MAVDLSDLTPPWAVKRVTLGLTGIAVAVTLPPWCRYLSVQFFESDGTTAAAGKVASSATDGQAIGNDVWSTAAGVAVANIPVSDGLIPHGNSGPTRTVYLAGGTDSGYAQLILQRDAS